MSRMVAYCGLVCSECEAYRATQADDQEWLERVAAQWREEYHAPGIAAENIACDGCTTVEGRHCGHWSECEIVACGVSRGVANCAHCPDYACEKVAGLLEMVPAAKATLEEIRASL